MTKRINGIVSTMVPFYVYIFRLFSIVSVAVCRSSFDAENFLALRLVLMILIGVSFAAAGAIVCNPTCLLFIV